MLRVLELFAGIGACSKALTNLGIEHEIVDAVEIDKYAVASFNAIHGTNFEPQDITKWDKDIECDLIIHGSPCQDFSIAGLQAGGDKDSGTRSSLMYETLRIVEKLKPKYVIWENVKNLLSKKHRHNFDTYLEAMEKLGYTNYYQVLNAKDYGVPQNRERVFTVSILGEEGFRFPAPRPLTKRLKDVLEEEVDEKYYLSDEQIKRLKNATYNCSKEEVRVQNADGVPRTLCARDWKDPKCVRVGGLYDKHGKRHQAGSIYDPHGIAATLSTMQGGNQEPIIVASRGRNPENPSDRTAGLPTIQRLEPRLDGCTNTLTSVQKDNYDAIKTANKTGYDLATDGDGIDLAYPDSKTRRGRVGHGVSKTLPTSDSQGVLLTKGDNDAENQRDTEILPILRKEIGEKTFQEWAIGGLWCILSEAVLWERVYAPSVYKNWIEQPKLVKFAYFGKNNKPTVSTQESVRNMWIDWQDRYSSYRRELPEQLSREFTSVVQELPHEVTSWQKFVQDLRKASEGLGILRQALSEIQEIWQPDAHWEVQRSSMRIRKLTPLSCWRLMGFDDTDFEKAAKVNSNSQLYKQAGNSIVVNVLEAILEELLYGSTD